MCPVPVVAIIENQPGKQGSLAVDQYLKQVFDTLDAKAAKHGLDMFDYNGHISRRGDHQVRSLLYEAASVILTRSWAQSALRDWGLKLRERIGFKRAAVAIARKLAVIMHAMLKSGELFDRSAGAPA